MQLICTFFRTQIWCLESCIQVIRYRNFEMKVLQPRRSKMKFKLYCFPWWWIITSSSTNFQKWIITSFGERERESESYAKRGQIIQFFAISSSDLAFQIVLRSQFVNRATREYTSCVCMRHFFHSSSNLITNTDSCDCRFAYCAPFCHYNIQHS